MLGSRAYAAATDVAILLAERVLPLGFKDPKPILNKRFDLRCILIISASLLITTAESASRIASFSSSEAPLGIGEFSRINHKP